MAQYPNNLRTWLRPSRETLSLRTSAETLGEPIKGRGTKRPPGLQKTPRVDALGVFLFGPIIARVCATPRPGPRGGERGVERPSRPRRPNGVAGGAGTLGLSP